VGKKDQGMRSVGKKDLLVVRMRVWARQEWGSMRWSWQ